jgi:hypothetical protein
MKFINGGRRIKRMFKPTTEHLEELMRAKEICESIIDEIEFPTDINQIHLNTAAAAIEEVLDSFTAQIEALTP